MTVGVVSEADAVRETDTVRRSVTDPAQALWALSPVDGRYRHQAAVLSPYFSEGALIRYRVHVEVEYFLALLDALGLGAPMSDAESLRHWASNLGDAELLAIKAREKELNHDVKAVEYAVKDAVQRTLLGSHFQKVHLGLTSEDVNNLAYGLMQTAAVRGPLWTALRRLMKRLAAMVQALRATPMLARTHGQPATPTTLGKELGVFLHRLSVEVGDLPACRISGKLNGATGTYGAMAAAYPQIDWSAFSRRFVAGLDLDWNPVTTQIEPHDSYAALYDRLRRIGNILLDMSCDLWRYVSDGYFRQRPVAGEVGSSAMPHKVNPIDFENAEGNLGLANALFAHMGDKLARSRLQRDLSDSTVLRNVGVAFAHLLLALKAMERGLGKLEVDESALRADLAAHPEILAEAYQAVLRAEGHEAPYEALKDLTRGREVSLEALRAWIRELPVSPEAKTRLLALTPETYTGLAPQVADAALSAAGHLFSTYVSEDGE